MNEHKNLTLNGIGASEGVAVAKSYLLTKPNFEINSNKITDSQSEINKIEDAIKTAVKQIEEIKTIALSKVGDEHAMVFDAHMQIANDPELKNQIEQMVKDDLYNGAYAIEVVFNNTHDLFANLDDEYFKQRASDVIDVKQRILAAYLNVELPNLLTINSEVIIVANDLTPSETALLDKKYVKGFVTEIGGKTSHAAIMARTMEIPAVLGIKEVTKKVDAQTLIAMDGNSGQVVINPTDLNRWNLKIENFLKEKEELKKYINVKTKTVDGHEVLVVANIGKPEDVKQLDEHGSQGIGLVRSEFLYMDNNNWPSQEVQFEAYKSILVSQKNKLVIVRTLDIGGDKKLNYYQFPHESNPFLGYRAIRFCLDNKQIFETQIKALLRASVFGKLGIMFPMIATVDEFLKAKQVVMDVKKEFSEKNIAYDNNVLIGMMIEIPASVLLVDQFANHADFFSIGTNDLIQYTLAADRMSENVSYLYQPNNPSILRAIKYTIENAKSKNKFVGMCGEMAGDVKSIPILLGLGNYGLDEFSMSASSILKAKKIICSLKHSDCIELANQAVMCETSQQVDQLVDAFLQKNNIII